MSEPKFAPTIKGDVHVESVTVNAKGGSLSAILKQSLRRGFVEDGSFYGARMDFEDGTPVVIIAQRFAGGRRYLVTQIADNRYMIELEEDAGKETVDPMTKATLQILEQMTKAGKLTLLDSDETDKRLAKMQKSIAEGDKLAGVLRKRLKPQSR
jgi:hypothetical protein